MTRERIEDLGRLAVMLDQIRIHETFDKLGRPKYANEMFDALSEEKQDELIYDLAYFLEYLQEKICECQSIAQGTDNLNNMDLI